MSNPWRRDGRKKTWWVSPFSGNALPFTIQIIVLGGLAFLIHWLLFDRVYDLLTAIFG